MTENDDRNINLTDSVFVNGSVGGSVVNITGNKRQFDTDGLGELLTQLRSLLINTPPTSESKSEMEAEIETVEIQLKSPKPKQKIIIECLRTIRSIAEGVAGNTAYAAIAASLSKFLSP